MAGHELANFSPDATSHLENLIYLAHQQNLLYPAEITPILPRPPMEI